MRAGNDKESTLRPSPGTGLWTIGRLAAALLLCAFSSPSAGAAASPADRQHLKAQLAIDESAQRDDWQKPGEVLAALGLAEGQIVADIGAGTGYFARRFSAAVGRAGRVYAVEIEEGPLEYLRNRARDEGMTNIVPTLAVPDDPRIPDGSSDLIFLCDTYHLIKDRSSYLTTLAAKLRPGGKLALIDWRAGSGAPAAIEKHLLPVSQVEGEVEQAGFEIVDRPTFLPRQYFLVAKPRR